MRSTNFALSQKFSSELISEKPCSRYECSSSLNCSYVFSVYILLLMNKLICNFVFLCIYNVNENNLYLSNMCYYLFSHKVQWNRSLFYWIKIINLFSSHFNLEKLNCNFYCFKSFININNSVVVKYNAQVATKLRNEGRKYEDIVKELNIELRNTIHLVNYQKKVDKRKLKPKRIINKSSLLMLRRHIQWSTKW